MRTKHVSSHLCFTTIQFVFLFDGRYWMLDVSKVYASGSNAWDTAVHDASEEYKHRMVILVVLETWFLLTIQMWKHQSWFVPFVLSEAQPLLWQLSLTCRHGSESDAIWKQHLMEYGQPLPPRSDPWETCQVRTANMPSCWQYCLWTGNEITVHIWRRWLSCWDSTCMILLI